MTLFPVAAVNRNRNEYRPRGVKAGCLKKRRRIHVTVRFFLFQPPAPLRTSRVFPTPPKGSPWLFELVLFPLSLLLLDGRTVTLTGQLSHPG